jgi:two-component system phosphate regulon response regulator OmpR
MTDEFHLLIVEDNGPLRERLARYLRGEGFLVGTAADAAEARAQLRALRPDLLVLDVMMPGETGLELTQALRANPNTCPPVLILTARGTPEDRIAGFEAGADDYLPKPFEPRELVLRIKALLRRTPPQTAPAPSGKLRFGTLEFDRDRGELRDPDGSIRLTGGEAALLSALAARPGETLSRDDLAEALGTGAASERAIDVQVTRLRRKIEADPREPRFLHTVRGRGYVLKPGN